MDANKREFLASLNKVSFAILFHLLAVSSSFAFIRVHSRFTSLSVIEQKRRVVNQRPRKVLRSGEAPVFKLLGAGLRVVAQLDELRIERDGTTDSLEDGAVCEHLRVDRQRLFGGEMGLFLLEDVL